MNALIAFQNITLIDGTSRVMLSGATVGVRNGIIIYAGPAKKWQPSLDEDIINLDFVGKYLMPGLIDCHVHLARGNKADLHFSDGSRALEILGHARHNLSMGFTTIRDFGGRNDLTMAVRRAIQNKEFSGPRILLSGRLSFDPLFNTNSLDRIREMVHECLTRGIDLIEWCSSDLASLRTSAARVVVEEVVAHEKHVALSTLDVNETRDAVKAGVHTIEHGAFLHGARDVLDEMARRGTFLVSTLKTDRNGPSGAANTTGKPYPTRSDSLKSLQMAYQAGTPIAMGSGAGTAFNVHGENAVEIHRMEQAGIKPMDVLIASTSGAAKALGCESRLGSVEVGKTADLLILDENPLDDLRRLADKKQIRAVFRDGKLVARQPVDSYPKTIFARDCLTAGE